MYLKNSNFWVRGLKGISYMAKITDCRTCPLRSRCLRRTQQDTGSRTQGRVYFLVI